MNDTMSLLGLYKADNTILNSMELPDGFDSGDQEIIINNLLMECAELEVLYTDPVFMKWAVQMWSRKEVPTWQRIYNASLLEYDPIENYNRYEESTETIDGTRKHSGNDSRHTVTDDSSSKTSSGTVDNTEQNSGTDFSDAIGSDNVSHTGTDVVTNNVSAFDSNSLLPHDSANTNYGHNIRESKSETNTMTHGKKTTNTGSSSGSESASYDGDTTETFTHGEQIKDDSDRTTVSHIHGNIGVTTSQQMLESELEISAKLNIFNIIIDSFKNRFCLLVY